MKQVKSSSSTPPVSRLLQEAEENLADGYPSSYPTPPGVRHNFSTMQMPPKSSNVGTLLQEAEANLAKIVSGSQGPAARRNQAAAVGKGSNSRNRSFSGARLESKLDFKSSWSASDVRKDALRSDSHAASLPSLGSQMPEPRPHQGINNSPELASLVEALRRDVDLKLADFNVIVNEACSVVGNLRQDTKVIQGKIAQLEVAITEQSQKDVVEALGAKIEELHSNNEDVVEVLGARIEELQASVTDVSHNNTLELVEALEMKVAALQFSVTSNSFECTREVNEAEVSTEASTVDKMHRESFASMAAVEQRMLSYQGTLMADWDAFQHRMSMQIFDLEKRLEKQIIWCLDDCKTSEAHQSKAPCQDLRAYSGTEDAKAKKCNSYDAKDISCQSQTAIKSSGVCHEPFLGGAFVGLKRLGQGKR